MIRDGVKSAPFKEFLKEAGIFSLGDLKIMFKYPKDFHGKKNWRCCCLDPIVTNKIMNGRHKAAELDSVLISQCQSSPRMELLATLSRMYWSPDRKILGRAFAKLIQASDR